MGHGFGLRLCHGIRGQGRGRFVGASFGIFFRGDGGGDVQIVIFDGHLAAP